MLEPDNAVHSKQDYYKTEIYALIELIGGKFYQRVHPSPMHQQVLAEILFQINDYCEVNKDIYTCVMGPVAVELGEDTIVEPDIIVVNNKSRLCEECYKGAPIFVIEVVSPDDQFHDYVRKLKLYKESGVREYWVVNEKEENVATFVFDNSDAKINIYSFEDSITSSCISGLKVNFSEFKDKIWRV